MSSLYVKVRNGFYTHRKTLRLRAALGNDAYWIPPRLWAYASDHQPNGDFSDFTAEEIASLIGYTGNASIMLQALLKAGFMDEFPLRIHDWGEHNEYHKIYAERAKKAATARWAKSNQLPDNDTDNGKGKGASIASSNPPALKISEVIKLEKELVRVNAELRTMGKLSDHDIGTKNHKRHVELSARQIQIRKTLGVTA